MTTRTGREDRTTEITPAEFAAEAEVCLTQMDPELEYNRADLYGFVAAAWPFDGSPMDAAAQFAEALQEN